MNRRADLTTSDGFVSHTIYVTDDLVCCGLIEFGSREQFMRAAYRDVYRLLAWDGRRRYATFLGIGLLLFFLAVAALVGLAAQDVVPALVPAVVGAGAFAIVQYRGRAGAITRLRLYTAHGEVETALGGAPERRARILWDIEQRILARQDVAPAPDAGLSPDDGTSPPPA